MKTLYLVRHAKSSWDNPRWTDFERPLNRRGEHNAPFMAEMFAARKKPIDLIISSPAMRAISTAHYFAKSLDIPIQNIVSDAGIYDATVNDLLRIVNSISDQYAHVMMFGHNPGFSQLVHYLTGKPIDMPTCAIVRIGTIQESWAHVSGNCGVLEDFDFPKKHLGDL